MSLRFILPACILTLMLAASSVTALPTNQTAPPPIPLVDHHQHLLSPAGAVLANSALFKVTPVAADIAELLGQIPPHWNDKNALAPLYTDDAIANTMDGEWKHGRDAVADYLSKRFRASYRLIPVDVDVNGATAHIAGRLARGDGAGAKIIGVFALTLMKNDGGAWRISMEITAFPGPPMEEPETAADLVRWLDDAGIKRAVVLSEAYWFDSPRDAPESRSYDDVRAENDWTAEQVSQFPDRLVAFCSLNPLSDYAIKELDRCAASGRFKGLKLHFGSSAVNLLNPAHVAKVRAVVAEANRLRMPLIVHVRRDSTYGAKDARVLLDQIVSAAPDVPFTIAHLWGGEAYSDEALTVYAHAVGSHDPHTKNLYFDIAELVLASGNDPIKLKKIAAHMREIGMSRILYGTDGPVSESQTPKQGWDDTLANLPLTPAEFKALASNVAPYLR